MRTLILKSAFFALLFLASTGQLYAQEIPDKNEETEQDSIFPIGIKRASINMYEEYFKVSSPSPNVAELMKYVDIPVNLSTGTPSIEIPLYMIECGDLSVPITLCYHASGIKVDQMASWVGLGWSLNAGGVVTRTQLDSKGSGNAHSLKTKEQLKEYINTNNFEMSTANLEHWTTNKSIPDLFSYNFMGYGGKFFAYEHKAYDLSGSKELQFDNIYPTNTTKLKATDLQGVVYEFEAVEKSTTYTFGLSISDKSNVWNHANHHNRESPPTYSYMLTKVSSPKGNSIEFIYREETESYKTITTGALSTRSSSWSGKQDDFGNTGAAYTIADTYCRTQKLSEIKASNGLRITFTANTSRTDIVAFPDSDTGSLKALNEIKIYDGGDKLINKWGFEYDYFVSPISHPKKEHNNRRLKLTCIKEYGNGNTALSHSFAYYGENSGEPELPFRGAFGGRDFLGYCNSAPNLSNAINIDKSFPKASSDSPLLGEYLPDGKSYPNGGDLNTNENYVHAYSLKSITYPTGGKKVFEYEPHSIYKASKQRHYGGLRIKKIIDYFSDTDYTTREYKYADGYINYPASLFRKRSRDAFSTDLSSDHEWNNSPALPYYEVSSSPRTTLASYTSDGIKYAYVEEINGSSKIVYRFTSDSGRDDADEPMYVQYISHRAIFQRKYDSDFRKWWLIYNHNFDKEDYHLYFNLISPDYKHGHLKSKTIHAEDDLIIHEAYEYDFEVRDIIPLVECTYGSKEWCRSGYSYYDVTASNYFTGKAKLIKKTINWHKSVSDIDWKDPYMYQEEVYTYNDHDKVTSVETTTSKGEKMTTTTRYTSDINSGIYNTMKEKKMIDYPVEIVNKIDDKAVNGTLVRYDNFLDTLFLPGKIYELQATAPLESFTNYDGEDSPGSWYGDFVAEIKNYTGKGKIASLTNREQLNVVYLWGYKHMYPIAEIRNASYESVTAIIEESKMREIADKYEPSAADWTEIEKLRNIPGAQVTVTKYFPHKGVKSITGPDKRIVNFDYNTQGQLKEKFIYRDHVESSYGKQVLESYKYNYKN